MKQQTINKPILLVQLLILLVIGCCSPTPGNNNKHSWNGNIKKENNIVTVYNPATPSHGEITFQWTETLSIGKPDDENQFFYRGIDFDLDEQGNIYILDSANCRIQVFNQEGQYLETIGRKGQGPEEFTFPIRIQLDQDNNTYVLNSPNLIKILDNQAKFKNQHLFPDNIREMNVGKAGTFLAIIYAFDFNRKIDTKTLAYYDASKKKIKEFLSVENRSVITNGGDILMVTFPELEADIYFTVSPSGHLFCGKNTDYTIYQYEYESTILLKKVIVDEKPRPLTEEEKENRATRTYTKNPRPVINKIKELIKHQPVFYGMEVDDKGWLFVFKKKTIKEDEPYTVDIFSPDGKYTFKTSLPWMPRIKSNTFWVKTKNQEGDSSLKKYVVSNYSEYIH